MPKRKKKNAETARFGWIHPATLAQRLLDVSVSWGAAAEEFGPNSPEARDVEDEWKDLAVQVYLRSCPQAIDDEETPIPRPTPPWPSTSFAELKARRAREKAEAAEAAE